VQRQWEKAWRNKAEKREMGSGKRQRDMMKENKAEDEEIPRDIEKEKKMERG
jgi:hypothetical protein